MKVLLSDNVTSELSFDFHPPISYLTTRHMVIVWFSFSFYLINSIFTVVLHTILPQFICLRSFVSSFVSSSAVPPCFVKMLRVWYFASFWKCLRFESAAIWLPGLHRTSRDTDSHLTGWLYVTWLEAVSWLAGVRSRAMVVMVTWYHESLVCL
jgi:hypothetical protein